MKSKLVASGNGAIDRQRPGFVELYDRGELLWLIAANVSSRGADLEELAHIAELTDAEIADVRTMID
jgi:hypothetical protein